MGIGMSTSGADKVLLNTKDISQDLESVEQFQFVNSYENKVEPTNISYIMKSFLFFTFPYNKTLQFDKRNNPKDTSTFSRVFIQEDEKLEIALFSHSQTVPFGIYARRMFVYFCKQAKLGNKVVDIGQNRTDFFKKVLGRNSHASEDEINELTAQFAAFFTCSISFKKTITTKDGFSVDTKTYTFFNSTLSSYNKQNWQQKVILSDDFYNEIHLEKNLIPIDNEFLYNHHNSRQIDIYNYLCYQNFIACKKHSPISIKKNILKDFFGYDIKLNKHFNEKLKNIINSLLILSKLKLQLSKDCLIITPSSDALLVRKLLDQVSLDRSTNEEQQPFVQSNTGLIIKKLVNKGFSQFDCEIAVKFAISQDAKNVEKYARSALINRYHQKLFEAEATKVEKSYWLKYTQLDESLKAIFIRDFLNKIKSANMQDADALLQAVDNDIKTRQNTILKSSFNNNILGYYWWYFNNFKEITIFYKEDEKLIFRYFNQVKYNSTNSFETSNLIE